jgi:hypothetical protein
MGSMAVMGRSGDTKVIWSADNEDEVANARRTFDDLVTKRGFAAFAVGARGNKTDRVREFDPTAEKIIIVPPMQGGC